MGYRLTGFFSARNPMSLRYCARSKLTALTAQRSYHLLDSILPEFSFASDVKVEYLGDSCTVPQPPGDEYTVNSSSAGCGFLDSTVETTGDYLKVSYRAKAPPLEYFLNNSVNASNFTFPAASLSLVS